MFRSLLGLAVLAAATPALAAGPEPVAPIQAVMEDFGGKKVLAYYTSDAGRCDLVLMTGEEPGPRVRVSLTPDQAATIEDVAGGKVTMTCGGAARMTVERTPPVLKAASAE